MQIDRLCDAIRATQCPACVGLDTELSHLPDEYQPKEQSDSAIAACVFRYNCDIIDAIRDVAPSVKVQAAYYEAVRPGRHALLPGHDGLRQGQGADRHRGTSSATISASTASAYARAYVENSAADFITVNAYPWHRRHPAVSGQLRQKRARVSSRW